MIITFLVIMGLFVAIGISSFNKSQNTKQDYYLASGSVNPLFVGLSAVATNSSGYMFIGVIGYTYVMGLSSVWLVFGWALGDFIASSWVHKRLRLATEKCGEVSYAGVLSHWYGDNRIWLQRVIGLISLIFLLAYASAQLVAGSKALQVLFGWPHWAGAVMGCFMVIAYCYAGGIRASIWTDVAQSLVMMIAMTILLVVAVDAQGGWAESLEQFRQIEGFMDWFPDNLALPGIAGQMLFTAGWVFGGFSVIGQPHIMVRFMTLNDSRKINQARGWYYLWYISFKLLALGVGMLARLLLEDTGAFDAELALPTIALQLLPPVMVGVILAGIFAATMSTADSLVLSCSAALTHDLLPHKVENTHVIKLFTVVIALTALCWALFNQQSVFNLVIMAWSGLGSAFAPLAVILCLGRKSSEVTSIMAVITGLAVALSWRFLGWNEWLYEGLPGLLSGLVVHYAFGKQGRASVEAS